MSNELFVQQRRFSGLDLYHAPQDVAPDQLLQSDNCVNYGGELWTRPGFQGVFATPMSAPIYAATEFVRSDGSTVILFVSGGKLYFAVKQDPPMTQTEILIYVSPSSSISFALNSEKARIYVEGKYAYVVDGEYAYSDLVIDGSDAKKVTSATRPFVAADAPYKQLTITGPKPDFTPGTYAISSLSGSAAVLSASVGTTGKVSGTGTLSGPLYRVNVSADGVALAAAVTGLMSPSSAPSCSLTNTALDLSDNALKWSSFPPLSWVGGVGVVASGGVGGPETIINAANQRWSGGTGSPTPAPTGWIVGGDTMGFQAATIGGVECYFDAGANPEWVDWDYPSPAYAAGANTINAARVWVATAHGHSGGGGSFQMQIFPEAASVTSQVLTTYSDLTMVTAGSSSTISSAAHPFQTGDVYKVVTILSGTNWTAGNYTITAVNAGTHVATVNGNVGTVSGSGTGTGTLNLDSGGAAYVAHNDENFTLQSPLSAIPGAEQSSPVFKAVLGDSTYSQVFSFTGLSKDFDYIKYRLFGAASNSPIGVNQPSLKVVDVGMVVANASTGHAIHVKANNPLGIGYNCLGGCWIRRDYTDRTVTDLHIDPSVNTKVTSSSFSSSDVGRVLHVTSGSGFTPGVYKITGVTGTTATLSTGVGTLNSSPGTADVIAVVDWSTTNAVSIAYSAPSTSGNIPMRMGFQAVGDTAANVVWTYPSTYITDSTGTYLFTDISTVPVSTRQSALYVYLQILNDLPTTVDPADLFTFGPITASGNLTVGSGDYVYVVTEAEDTRFDTLGASTGVTTDGVIESNPSPPSALLTPTGINDQTKMTIPGWTNLSTANYFYVYRLGGPFTATDPIATYRLIARLPKWTSVIDSSSPGASYCTWDPGTLTFTDNTPDGVLFTLVSTLVSGHDAPPVGATCVTGWRGRVVLAKGASLYVSDLLNTDTAAALYYPTVNVPNDPNGVVKGWVVPVSPNDGDSIKQIVASGQYLLIFKGRSLSVMSGTNPYDFVLTEHLKLAGVGLAAPQGVALVEDSPWFVGLNAIWTYGGGESPRKTSMPIEPALAPQTKGGDPIRAAARALAVAEYHDQRFYVAMPGTAGDSTNNVIWVYDTRGQSEGGPLGWTRFIPPLKDSTHTISFTSICSLSASDDTGDLFFGADDGQLYEHAGSGDIRSFVAVTDASNTSPIVVTTSTAHGFVDRDTVVILGVIGNAAANGTFYVNASSYDPNQCGLYSDEGLTVPVAGTGLSSFSNLVINASDSTKVTSSGHSFGPSDVGKSINILAGSGFTACTPYVLSVDGGSAKLSMAVGTAGSSSGSSQAFGIAAKPAPVTFTVKSRGMAQEESGQRWFETNRPTRVLARLTTQETTSVTLTCSTDNQPASVFSTVGHVNIPAGAIQLRDKVNSGVRGDAVFVTISGSTVRPTRVTSVAVEAADGSIRGNA